MRVKNVFRFFTVALFLAVVSSMNASGGSEIIRTYYIGCNPGTLYQIGQSGHLCSGGSWSTGSSSEAWWMEVESTSCDTGDGSDTFFERCDTGWVQRSVLGACECEHHVIQ
ncbi:MAG TPA: hypothetical protein VHY33_12865 [Thermoanaerobaculia bacterium]|nr:hypothetical protein [Thermoanaerobaculia bacterium]